MDLFLATGERSGDVIAEDLVSGLRQEHSGSLRIRTLSGLSNDLQGTENIRRNPRLSSVGIEPERIRGWETVFDHIVATLADDPPDAFVAITHHAFNILLAQRLKNDHPRIQTMLIGPPEIWAWKPRRIASLYIHALRLLVGVNKRLARELRTLYLDRGAAAMKAFQHILCLLQIDWEAYSRLTPTLEVANRANILRAPHPFLRYGNQDIIGDLEREAAKLRERVRAGDETTVIGVFPGSRESTISELLPIMLKSVSRSTWNFLGRLVVIVSVADPAFRLLIRKMIAAEVVRTGGGSPEVYRSEDSADVLLSASDYAVLSAGSVTLQAGCLGTPGVIVYRVGGGMLSRVGALLAKRQSLVVEGEHVRIPMGLPNILGGRIFYPEYVQRRCRARYVAREIATALKGAGANPPKAQIVDALRRGLGEDTGTDAGRHLARIVLSCL